MPWTVYNDIITGCNRAWARDGIRAKKSYKS